MPAAGTIGVLKNGREIEYLGKSVGGTLHHVRFMDDGECIRISLFDFLPIELPEEKAARLREEWCSKALDSAGILSEMKRYELKRLGEYIGSIHDALQSGELKMPEVQK